MRPPAVPLLVTLTPDYHPPASIVLDDRGRVTNGMPI